MKLTYNEGAKKIHGMVLHYSSIDTKHVEELLGRTPKKVLVVGSWDGGDELRFKDAWPDCKVHGVEASPTAYERAKKVSSFGINVHHFAMAGHDGHVTFYGTDNCKGEWCSGSVLKHTEDFSKDTGVVSRPAIVVPCKRLDTFCAEEMLNDIDLMQMDTEGYIGEILSGFGEQRPKILFIEILPVRWYMYGDAVDAVITKLSLMGYENIDNNGVDWLFVRKK